ncbi:MAG: hypothetical protein ACRC0A_05280 [Chitinophagaceae bacterium]
MSIQLDDVVYQALPIKGVFAQHISKETECQEMVAIEVDERKWWNIECHLKYELGIGYDYGIIFRFLFFANYKKITVGIVVNLRIWHLISSTARVMRS